MPRAHFNFDLIWPSWVQRMIRFWQVYGPLLKWLLKWGVPFIIGYFAGNGVAHHFAAKGG